MMRIYEEETVQMKMARVTAAIAIPNPSSLNIVCFAPEYARRKYLKNSSKHDLNSRDTGDNYTAAKRLHRECGRDLQYIRGARSE